MVNWHSHLEKVGWPGERRNGVRSEGGAQNASPSGQQHAGWGESGAGSMGGGGPNSREV